MLVLALDSALAAAQVAILDGDRVLAAESRPMASGHAEAVTPMVEAALAAAGRRYADLDRIAVTIGPGSFAGVRIGLATARALGLALERPVVGVSTLAAFAAGHGSVTAVIDARRGGVYLQAFAADGAPLGAPTGLALDEAAAALGAGARLVGTGAALLTAPRPDTVRLDGPAVPDIVAVARLGAAAPHPAAPPAPLYLRPPDAKPQAPPPGLRP